MESPQLKVLKLQISFAFKEWTVSDDAFPKLEQLVYVIVENLRRSHLVLEKSLLLSTWRWSIAVNQLRSQPISKKHKLKIIKMSISSSLPRKIQLELEMVTQVWRSFTFSEDECSEDEGEDEDAWMDV
ncbi:hypothetical protein P3S68_021911 [Capsicum galapagoense]